MAERENLPPPLNEQRAADYLGLSVHTLRKWRRLHRGPLFVKFRGKERKGRGFAGRVVYHVADLRKFMDASTVATDAPPTPAVFPAPHH
jgi:hypothetical protein